MKASVILLCMAALLLLPACRIGSGFDTAEKRRNLNWDEPIQSAQPTEDATVEQLQSPPIVYLLVAG